MISKTTTMTGRLVAKRFFSRNNHAYFYNAVIKSSASYQTTTLFGNNRCFSSTSSDPQQTPKKKKKRKKALAYQQNDSSAASAAATLESIVQWAISSHQEPTDHHPNITTRFTFTFESPTISIQTPSDRSTIQLTKSQTLSASLKLLAPLIPDPSPLPLNNQHHPLNSSNLLRPLPQSPPPLTVEFSSPNIAKPLHMGHLRSTITGSYIRKIAEFAGHDCKSVCFLGDWGRQFGVLRAGVENEMKVKGTSDFSRFIQSLELHDLLQIYVKASKRLDTDDQFKQSVMDYSSQFEDDKSTVEFANDGLILWTHTRNLTICHLKSCYNSLNISFDVYEAESEFRLGSDHTRRALELMESKGLSERHDDLSVRIAGKESNNILVKRDGSSVYLLRDVACALRRLDESDEENRRFVYVVDSSQSDHFKNLFGVLEGLGVHQRGQSSYSLLSSSHIHIPFNRVVGMSTRSGNFVLLSQVISEGTQLMHATRAKSKNARNIEDMSVSQQLAVSGLIVNSLKMRRSKSYEFDWDEALRSTGNSGVALQYTVVRLRSLFRRVREEIGVDGGWDGVVVGEKELSVVFSSGNDELVGLVVSLMNFEDTFWNSYTQLEPCILVSYCFNLSDKISRVLASIRIVDGSTDRDLADAALWLLGISERVLHSCMGVIGVKVVDGEGF